MGFYSRQNVEQSRLTDEVYAVIQRHDGVVLGDGRLTKETKQEARSILAAIELLAEEKKIRIETSPKEEFGVALLRP
jgi:putative IMPACT (imprinted ancient) family translation regulator